MPLEDHIGDICRKARLQTKTPVAGVSSVAGLSEAQLHEWETEGMIDVDVNVEGLATLVGLDVAKAKAIADGWIPEPVDLSQWSELRVVTTACSFCAIMMDDAMKVKGQEQKMKILMTNLFY